MRWYDLHKGRAHRTQDASATTVLYWRHPKSLRCHGDILVLQQDMWWRLYSTSVCRARFLLCRCED